MMLLINSFSSLSKMKKYPIVNPMIMAKAALAVRDIHDTDVWKLLKQTKIAERMPKDRMLLIAFLYSNLAFSLVQ